MSAHTFHLFVYGTLRTGGAATAILDGCERVREAMVNGLLYRVSDDHPALMLYGGSPVRGEIWRCPAELLPRLDSYEGTADGLFRRVGVEVDGTGCWTYVAGPALARRLTAENRIASGDWLQG